MLVANHQNRDLGSSLSVCLDLLPSVSRSFAISILHLRGPLRTAVITSYLLCRIADTVEDDPQAPVAVRSQLFDLLRSSLTEDAAIQTFTDMAGDVLAGEGAHLRLVSKTPDVFVLHRSLNVEVQEVINRWVSEMIVGMNAFVIRYPGGIHLQTIEEFHEYCYYVAGTVGHLLTELWKLHSNRIDNVTFTRLNRLSEAFGEGLQTVNILKDIASDVEKENAVFLPELNLKKCGSSQKSILDPDHIQENREVVTKLIALARNDLDQAMEYYLNIPKSAFAIRRFCILPLLFAFATIRELSHTDAMLKSGGSVKITRNEVNALIMLSPFMVCSNHLVLWLARRVSRKPLA